MLLHPRINWRDMPAAFMGANMAAIADTTDVTVYRDMVWDIRTTLEPCENERRLQAWDQRRTSTKICCGVKGKNQLPLFMIWKEHWFDDEVVFAKVLFNSCNWFGV